MDDDSLLSFVYTLFTASSLVGVVDVVVSVVVACCCTFAVVACPGYRIDHISSARGAWTAFQPEVPICLVQLLGILHVWPVRKRESPLLLGACLLRLCLAAV